MASPTLDPGHDNERDPELRTALACLRAGFGNVQVVAVDLRDHDADQLALRQLEEPRS